MNNLYNQVDTTEIQPKDQSYIPAGIHDNVKITGIRYDISPYNVPFIEVTFVDANGAKGTATEREASQGQLDQEAFVKKTRNQLARIEKIAAAINGELNTDPDKIKKEGQLAIPRFKDAKAGGTFKDVFQWLENIYKAHSAEQEYRIKFVYNENGGKYATLPKYTTYVWMEPMSIVDAGKSKIVKYGIDKFDEPVVVADQEQYVPKLNEQKGTDIPDLPKLDPEDNGLPF